MRKVTFIMVLMALMAVSAQAQLLYKVSGNGLKTASYVLGTYHLAPGSFMDSIPGCKQAFNEVAQVCGEIVEDNMLAPENLMKMQAAMMMPEGKTYQGMLGEEDLQLLNAFIKSMMGVDLTTPMVGEQLGKLSPAALTMQLSLMMYLKHTPDFDVQNAIDMYVQTLGKQQGKAVLGLETIDEQIHVLFESQTLERQLELLMCMVKHQDYQVQLADGIRESYFAQDLSRIESYYDDKLNDGCDSTPEEESVLIHGRNANWVKVMPGMMEKEPTLFVVGAMHLVGEKGVIELLKAQGYQVEGVK